jgi:sodium-dependent dicarboxylate transporter 2/3/5
MVGLLWIYILLVFRPEQEVIPGLRDRARRLHARLGPMKRDEVLGLSITLLAVGLMGLRSFVPSVEFLD